MASALEKAKKENDRLRKSMQTKARKERSAMQAVVQEASGQAGEAFGAVTTALVDAKFADNPSDMATFGDTKIPAMPVIGFAVGLLSLPLVKPAPAVAAGVGRFGTQMVWIGLYHGTRDKATEMFED